MNIIKKMYPLVFLFFLTACLNITSNNRKEKMQKVNCFSKADTLKMNNFETIGCSGELVYQFLNDTIALTIEFEDQLLLEGTCKEFDLVKDSNFIDIRIYEFTDLNDNSIIQMPLCTDILISNAIKPNIREPIIDSGKISIFKNSSCNLSFMMDFNLSIEDKLRGQFGLISAWNVEFCNVPG